VALDLTSYSCSDKSAVAHESAIIADEAYDKSIRLVDLSGSGTQRYMVSVVIEGLTYAQRDTLMDSIVGGGGDTITVDMGTRNYIGYLRPGSANWREKDGLSVVRFILQGATVV